MMRWGQWGRVLQEGSLYLVLFLLPFSSAAVEVGFGLLLLGWILQLIDPATRIESLWGRAPLRGILLSLAFYLLVCALSIFVSDYPSKSIKGFVEKWLEYLLFFVIASDIGARPGVIQRAMAVLATSSAFVFFEALWQEIFGRGLFRGHHLFAYARMSGPYENPTDLATYLVVIIPILFAGWITRRGKSRWVLGALILLLLGALGRTETLGAWLGLAVGLTLFLARKSSIRRYGFLLLVMLALIGVASLQRTNHLRDTLSLVEGGKLDRVVMWQAAMGMIRDRPILGHGLNTFMANYLKYWVGGEQQPRYAHNCYLQVAAETGLLGLAAFLTLLLMVAARLGAGFNRFLGDDESVWLLGWGVGLLAFVVQAAVDTSFYSLRQAALFWILSGCALGLSEKGAPSEVLSAEPLPDHAKTGGISPDSLGHLVPRSLP